MLVLAQGVQNSSTQVLVIVGTVAIVSLAIGLIIGMWMRKQQETAQIQSSRDKAESIVKVAEAEAKSIRQEAILAGEKDLEEKRRRLEAESESRSRAAIEAEARMRQREVQLEAEAETLTNQSVALEQRADTLRQAEGALADSTKIQQSQLEKIGLMTQGEAREILLSQLQDELAGDYNQKIREFEERYREDAAHKARRLLSLAIQRCAFDHAAETTTSVVSLADDNMKGRIIGREGRNIKHFEAYTGCDVIVDDSPDIVISAFDPVRREVARQAMVALIDHGLIQPARIEEEVEKARERVEESMLAAAKDAVAQVGIGDVDPALLKILGRLKYRFSYGQQVLRHSVEVAFLCANMASELGTNVMLAKRAGLFHDIGKAVDHDVEGTHAAIGAELAARYGEHPVVVHAIAAHHEEVPQEYVEAILAQVGDALSASRPGARGDSLDGYVRRLGKLEEIANSFAGVEKAYAIQAGRELRVLVNPEAFDDAAIHKLARAIANRIQNEVDFPGQIKVTVIRESRESATAK